MRNHAVTCLQGRITSCRRSGTKLSFHVDYDDGTADGEPLGDSAGPRFWWHGPRAASAPEPYCEAMRRAMLVLKPENLKLGGSEGDAAEPCTVRYG